MATGYINRVGKRTLPRNGGRFLAVATLHLCGKRRRCGGQFRLTSLEAHKGITVGVGLNHIALLALGELDCKLYFGIAHRHNILYSCIAVFVCLVNVGTQIIVFTLHENRLTKIVRLVILIIGSNLDGITQYIGRSQRIHAKVVHSGTVALALRNLQGWFVALDELLHLVVLYRVVESHQYTFDGILVGIFRDRRVSRRNRREVYQSSGTVYIAITFGGYLHLIGFWHHIGHEFTCSIIYMDNNTVGHIVDLVAADSCLFRQSVLRHKMFLGNCQAVLHLVVRTGMGQFDSDVVRQVVLRQRVTYRISLLNSTTGNTADILHLGLVFQQQTRYHILVITVRTVAVTDATIELEVMSCLYDFHLVFAHWHREREFAIGIGHHHLVVLHNRAAVDGEHSPLDRIGSATVDHSTTNVERTVIGKVHRVALRLSVDKANLLHRRELVGSLAWSQTIGCTVSVVRHRTDAVRTVGIGHTLVRKLAGRQRRLHSSHLLHLTIVTVIFGTYIRAVEELAV